MYVFCFLFFYVIIVVPIVDPYKSLYASFDKISKLFFNFAQNYTFYIYSIESF